MKKKEEKKEVCTFCQPGKKNIEKSNQHHFYVEFVYIINYIHDIYSPWHHPGKWADVWLDLMLLKFLLYVVISFTVI